MLLDQALGILVRCSPPVLADHRGRGSIPARVVGHRAAKYLIVVTSSTTVDTRFDVQR
jgi:hypothetical protein